MSHSEEGIQLDSRGKPRVQTHFDGEESLTVQSDAHMADIGHIVGQYAQYGILSGLNEAEAKFMDISEFTDFADAMRHAKMAEQDFMRLPSKVREVFGHSVENWLDTAKDEDKRDALVALGVIDAPPETGGGVVDPVVKEVVKDVTTGKGEEG